MKDFPHLSFCYSRLTFLADVIYKIGLKTKSVSSTLLWKLNISEVQRYHLTILSYTLSHTHKQTIFLVRALIIKCLEMIFWTEIAYILNFFFNISVSWLLVTFKKKEQKEQKFLFSLCSITLLSEGIMTLLYLWNRWCTLIHNYENYIIILKRFILCHSHVG